MAIVLAFVALFFLFGKTNGCEKIFHHFGVSIPWEPLGSFVQLEFFIDQKIDCSGN